MSDRRRVVEELLEGLSEEETEKLFGLLKDSVASRETKRNRRGRGKRKRKNKGASAEKDGPQPSSDAEIERMSLSDKERQELQEASEFDKKMGFDLPSKKVSKTGSPTTNRVEARCRVCGSVEMVSPAFVPPEKDRYKCNTCSCSAG